MEQKPIFTKYNIISFILIFVIIAVVIIAKISIDKVEEQEASNNINNIVVDEKEYDIVVDNPTVKPDVTWNDYNETIYNIETNNSGRYDFDYIEKILQEQVKYDSETVTMEFKNDAYEDGVFSSLYFKEYNSIWYPDQGLAIVIAKTKDSDASDNFIKDMRKFVEDKSKSLYGTGLSYLYTDYQYTSVNGYSIFMVCDNASVAMRKVINYMQVEDELAIRDYTDKYYTTDDGAFLREEEIVLPEENKSDIDKDLGQLPGNIQIPEHTLDMNGTADNTIEETTKDTEEVGE